MKKYRYFLFDMDNTLWDFDQNAKTCIVELMHERGLSQYMHNGGDAFYAIYKSLNDKLWIRYEAGEIGQQELRRLRFEQTFTEVGIPNAIALAPDFGEAYLERMPSKKALVPHAMEVLEYLYGKECPMALVSNGFKQVQYMKVRNSGLEKFFTRRMFISEEVGYHKPSPKIFTAALTALNAKKEETLMVGDNVVTDIEGAQVFGIDQFYFNPKGLPYDGKPTFMGDDLRLLTSLA